MTEVEIVVRRNRNGSVLGFADGDLAADELGHHRGVLEALYQLVDRRVGEDGETVATVTVDDSGVSLDVDVRFLRDLEPKQALALADDVRAAATGQLAADGGER